MRLVVVDPEDIPEWLYPGSFPEVPRPPEDCAELPDVDFGPLGAALGVAGDAVEPQSSHCSTGVPHSVPDTVGRLSDGLVKELATLPDGERWRVAREWAVGRLGKRANERELTRHKDMLKAICALAKRAVASRRPLIVL